MRYRTLFALCSSGVLATIMTATALCEVPRGLAQAPGAVAPGAGDAGRAGPVGSSSSPGPNDESERPRRPPGTLEVQFTDGSVLYLKLREDRLEFMTRYGRLQIPVADIEGVEFGLRIPEDLAKRIDSAVTGLGSSNFRTREAAGAALLELREKAYPALLRASKHSDTEVAHRAEELLNKLREMVPEERLTVREHDVVRTKDSVIAGNFSGATFKVSTSQFGEQQIKLADVARIGPPASSTAPADANAVLNDPGSLVPYQAQAGQTLAFRVTGALGGSLWGTDVYTLDSSLATAAVHAGLLTPGQTAVLKVTILGPQVAFQGSSRNGVTSAPYAQYPGAFRLYKDRRR